VSAEEPQVFISRVFRAPRALVYRAFTDPDQLGSWWGPVGNSVPRDGIDFDVRPGGFQRWTEVIAGDVDARTHVYIDLTNVANEELLEGVMHVTGRLRGGFTPFETTFRMQFFDEPDGRTRLEIRQWLPTDLAGPSEQGWLEALTKLDRSLSASTAETTKSSGGAPCPS
jgi:uncharacterized protein YndB with AHSA1/START domain